MDSFSRISSDVKSSDRQTGHCYSWNPLSMSSVVAVETPTEPVGNPLLRVWKRQRVVRALVIKCIKADITLPKELQDLVMKVTDVQSGVAFEMSKRHFESSMFRARQAVKNRLPLGEPLSDECTDDDGVCPI